MGTTPWSNDQPRDLVLPPGAGPNDPRIVIGPDVPDILLNFFGFDLDLVVKGCILFYFNADDYYFMFAATDNVGEEDFLTGFVNGNVVSDSSAYIMSDPNNPSTSSFIAFVSSLSMALDSPVLQLNFNTQGTVSIGDTDFNSDFLINGLGADWGLLDAVSVTTVGALNVAGSAETDIAQLQLTALQNQITVGRTYLVACVVLLNLTVQTDQWELRARLNTPVTGTQIADAVGTGTETGLLMFPWTPTSKALTTINFSHVRRSGTGTIQAFGAPNVGVARTWAFIRDISPAWRTA